jgi:hypothetical protein
VYQQSHRWLKAGVFAAMVHALREMLRLAQGRNAHPSAAIFYGRTLQSTPESGTRAGSDGVKRRQGSKRHMALHVTATNAQARSQLPQLAEQVQEVTGDAVEIVSVGQWYTDVHAAQDAQAHRLQLEVVKLTEAKKGFVLFPSAE